MIFDTLWRENKLKILKIEATKQEKALFNNFFAKISVDPGSLRSYFACIPGIGYKQSAFIEI